MTQELIYTSAPRGLKPGARGFCTVACTQGMSKPLAEQLEALSGYRPIYATGDERAVENPVNYSHSILQISGNEYHVLSRVADAGFDYTQRSNKLAHHVVLSERELTACGPAALLAAPGFMVQSWAGEPQLIPAGRPAREVPVPEGKCSAWERAAGDAGWGGVLAETALSAGQEPVVVIYRAGFEPLPLINEALSLLSMSARWKTTFSTYYTKGSGIDCRWRFMVDGTTEAKVARRMPNARLIDLCAPERLAEGGELVQAARTGARPAAPSSDDSARRRPERLVQFGTAAPAPAHQDAPAAEDVAYGVALPEMPPLSRPTIKASAKQREAAPARRRHKCVYGAITAVSLLLVGVTATVFYIVPKDAPESEGTMDARSESLANGVQKPDAPAYVVTNEPSASIATEETSPFVEENGEHNSSEQTNANENDSGIATTEVAPTLPAKPDVFEVFESMHWMVELPDTTVTDWQPLGEFSNATTEQLSIKLLGLEDALRPRETGTNPFTIASEENNQKLTLRYEIPFKETDVAFFQINNDSLQFKWGKEVDGTTVKEHAKLLKNCAVILKRDDREKPLSLAAPLRLGRDNWSNEFNIDSPVEIDFLQRPLSTPQLNRLKLRTTYSGTGTLLPIHGQVERKQSHVFEANLRGRNLEFTYCRDGYCRNAKVFLNLAVDAKPVNGSKRQSLMIELRGPKSHFATNETFGYEGPTIFSATSLDRTSQDVARWLGSATQDLTAISGEEPPENVKEREKKIATAKKRVDRLGEMGTFYAEARQLLDQLKDSSWWQNNIRVVVTTEVESIPIEIAELGAPRPDDSIEKHEETKTP